MPTDQETLEIAYYIRDLVGYSTKTKELANFFFEMLRVEQAVVMHELGDGFKMVNIRNATGEVVDREKVLFDEQDYQRRSGMVEGLSWLDTDIQFKIGQADDEDKRKDKEKENEDK